MVLFSLCLEEPETSAVGQILYQASREMLIGGGQECVLVETTIDLLASTAELPELRVGGGNPLDDCPARGETANKVEDGRERDLIDEQHVMNDAEHQDGVECAFGALEQA